MSEPWRRLPALTLKQIQYFVALARLRHFTDTANHLAISQPALSSALRQIESVLGGKLVNRNAQAVTLTEQGEAVLPHAEGLLNVAHAAFSDMQQVMKEGGNGVLRIGLVPSVSCLLFPQVPLLLREHFPQFHAEFHDQTNDRLLLELERGVLDFGIGALDSSVPDALEVYPLIEDQFVAVMRADDPLAESRHLTWRELACRDIAVFSKGNVSRLVKAMAESQRIDLKPRYCVDFIETLYGLVRSDLAVAILPRLYTTSLCDSQLTVVNLQQPTLSRTVALMRAKGLSRSTDIERCFTFLLQGFRQRLRAR